MSKKYFLLSTLLAMFSIVEPTAYASKYNQLQSSVLNKSNDKVNSSSTFKLGNVISFGVGGIAGAAVSSVVEDKFHSKELSKSINESNDWKDKYEKEYAEKEQLKEKNKVLKAENEKIKEQFINFKQNYGFDKNHSVDKLILYYNIGKKLCKFIRHGKKMGNGCPLEYLDSILNGLDGDKEKWRVLDYRNKDECHGNCAIFYQMLNGNNVLANFRSLPTEFQEFFIKVAIKNMAAIQAACNITVYNSNVSDYEYLKECRDIINKK